MTNVGIGPFSDGLISDLLFPATRRGGGGGGGREPYVNRDGF